MNVVRTRTNLRGLLGVQGIGKMLAVFVAAIFVCALLPATAFAGGSSTWEAFRGDAISNNAARPTNTAAPTTEAELRWMVEYKAEGASYVMVSDPVTKNGYLYLAIESIGADWMTSMGCTLLKIESNSGVVVSSKMIQVGEKGMASIEYTCRPVIVGDYVYVPLAGARLQGFSLDDLSPKWSNEGSSAPLVIDSQVGSQIYTTLNASEDGTKLYMGTMVQGEEFGTTVAGSYHCVDISEGNVVWSWADTSSGFYWSGAASVSCSDALTAIVTIGDGGRLLSLNAATGALLDSSDNHGWTGGKTRSTVVYDKAMGALFFVSTDGVLHKVELNADGRFTSHASVVFAAGSTSTPVVCEGKLYACGAATDWTGIVCVIDAATMTVEQQASAPADISGSAAVASYKDGITRAFFTSNAMPGALYMLEQGDNATEAVAIFTPETKNQDFCAASPLVDVTRGIICYTNDSGTLFAVRALYAENNNMSYLVECIMRGLVQVTGSNAHK